MEIIDLAAARAARESDKKFEVGEWLFNLSVFAPPVAGGQYAGKIFDAADLRITDAAHMRMSAAALENIAAILLDMAHFAEENDDGRVLGRVTVFESARVRTWVSEQIETEDQAQWLRDCMDDAKTIIRPSPTSEE